MRGANTIDPLLLSHTQDLRRKGVEIAEYPKQVKPLREGRLYITRTERGEHAKHSPREFFQPHSYDHLYGVFLDALNRQQFKGQHYCTDRDAREAKSVNFHRPGCFAPEMVQPPA